MKAIRIAAIGAVAVAVLSCAPLVQATEYTIKGFLGWIGDIRRTHVSGVAWPYIGINDDLRADYIDMLDYMQRTGMTQITLWGFLTNENWNPDIPSTVTADRAAEVRDWLNLAHDRGIKVLSGLGVYSWGFREIINFDPSVACASNRRVMSFSSSSSWEWQKDVIDYIMDNYDFDGVEMQSADRGECADGPANEVEYHSILSRMTGEYIKSKDPNYIVGIATWGFDIRNPNDIWHLVHMTEFADYLVDAGVSAATGTHRQNIATAIAPALLANMAEPRIAPIQSFEKDRYFVPITRRMSDRLKKNWDTGDRAGSFYVRSRGNPGDEVSVELLAAQANNITGDFNTLLEGVLTDLYQPKDSAALNDLVDLFLEAEDAYFAYGSGGKSRIRLNEMQAPTADSTPNYLTIMSDANIARYDAALGDFYSRADGLISRVHNACKMTLVKRCIGRAINDLVTVRGSGSTVSLPALDYCFDDGGGGGGVLTAGTHDDDAPEIVYNGNWSTFDDPNDYQGSEHYSITTGDWFEFSFYGTRATIHMVKDAWSGMADVIVDGARYVDAIDCYSANRQWQAVVFDTGDLPLGAHTVRVELMGRKNNKAAAFYYIQPDKIVIESDGGGGGGGTSQTIFTTQSPTLPNVTDGVSYDLGMKFVPAVDGQVTAIRYWHAASQTQSPTGRIWSAGGTQLASVAFPPLTGVESGWRQVDLPTPVSVQAGQTYVVSVGTNGYFPMTPQGLSSPMTSGNITVPAGGGVHGARGALGTFPTRSYQNSHYFRDVVFVPDGTSQTIFTTQSPTLPNVTDGVSYELGMKFVPAVDGQVTAIRYWHAASQTQSPTGRIWSAGGTQLASVAFPPVTGGESGWRQVDLPTPVSVQAGQTYVVSVGTNGYFPMTPQGLSSPMTSGNITVPAGGGVHGALGTFPTRSYQNSHYFRDAVFVPN